MKLGVILFSLLGMLVWGASEAYSAAEVEWAGGFPKVVEENVLLQWLPVKGAEEYKVYRGESKGKATFILATVKVNRFIDQKPTAGKTYYYKVAAFQGGKETASSKESEVSLKSKAQVVQIKAPTLVEPRLKDLPNNKVEVGLRWEVERATSLAGYNVYRSTAKGKGYTMIASAPGTSFNDSDVDRGKTYYYVVTAVDDKFNETSNSNEMSIEVPMPAKPVVAAKAEATKMRKAKLLFTIEKLKDVDGKVKPLETPVDVAVDEAIGHIYVIDAVKYNGVLVYDLDGRFQFGIKKEGAGSTVKFDSPHGVDVGQNGTVYVADYSSDEVRYFDGLDGRYKGSYKVDLEKLSKYTKKKLESGIIDIAMDSDGNLFAADPKSNMVHAINYAGKQVFSFGWATEKEKNPKFNGPGFTDFDSKDHYYMVDTGYARVMVYDNDGKYLNSFGRLGFEPGQFSYPSGLAIDKKDVIFVANGMDSNIQAFDTSGKFLYALSNEKGDGSIPSSDIRGIFVDSRDRLYVTEFYNNKVSVYQLLEGVADIVPPTAKQ